MLCYLLGELSCPSRAEKKACAPTLLARRKHLHSLAFSSLPLASLRSLILSLTPLRCSLSLLLCCSLFAFIHFVFLFLCFFTSFALPLLHFPRFIFATEPGLTEERRKKRPALYWEKQNTYSTAARVPPQRLALAHSVDIVFLPALPAAMFKNTFQSGFLSILYSIGSKPLQIWDKKVRARSGWRRHGKTCPVLFTSWPSFYRCALTTVLCFASLQFMVFLFFFFTVMHSFSLCVFLLARWLGSLPRLVFNSLQYFPLPVSFSLFRFPLFFFILCSRCHFSFAFSRSLFLLSLTLPDPSFRLLSTRSAMATLSASQTLTSSRS